MKRVAALLLSLTLALGLLSSCGNTNANETVIPSGPAQATQSADPTATPTPEPSAEPTVEPSQEPSGEPSAEPSAEPSQAEPTSAPATPAPTSTPAPAAGVDLTAFLQSIAEDDEEFAANMEVAGDFLENCYPGLSGIATKQRVIYQPRMTSVVCEIALVEVENSADVEAVKAILQARIDYQVGDDENQGGAWYPASIEGWQRDSRIVAHGNFVMMIAYSKCDSIVSAFNALF